MSEVELGFARPALLSALLLPLLVWLLARRPRRPVEVPTGTLAIWREVSEAAPVPGVHSQRRAPWTLLAALTLGALALAGPRWARGTPAAWSILVDRSPSMYLPHEHGGTRLERALGSAAAELERLGAGPRRWLCFDGQEFVAASGAAPPAAWLRAPRAPHPEPDWARLDRPRTLWVSDAAPVPAPRAAGLVLSGGRAVPGPAAVGPDGELLAFDGRELQPTGARAAPRAVSLAGSVAEPVRALAELWAAERGLSLVDAPPADGPALTLAGPPTGPAPGAAEPARGRTRIGRDGWELEVAPAALAVSAAEPGGAGPEVRPAALPWLEAGGLVQVAAAPGRVLLGFESAAAPRGDPAAFAVSWAGLFDACLLPPPGVVPVAERLAAGEARVQRPAPEAELDRGSPGPPLEALLAGAATLLVAWTLVPRRVRSARRLARRA